MNIPQMKKLLRGLKSERIKISSKVRFKIEKVHKVPVEDVLGNLGNPDCLTGLEEQPSREPHDETYGLVFELSTRKKLFVVITYKSLENKIYVVTAYSTTRKIEKLLKRTKIRRR